MAEPTAPAPRRRWFVLVLAVLVAIAVLASAIAIPLLANEGSTIVGGQPAEEEASLDEVEVFEISDRTHTRKPIEYDVSPPVGGQHNPVWLACGVYEEPVQNEFMVHDLEHGTVWITHRPDLASDEIEALAELLPQDGILSPYEDLQAPVVVVVWGRRLELTGAEDPRLTAFLAQFGAGETAPEPMASCAGGVRKPPPLNDDTTPV